MYRSLLRNSSWSSPGYVCGSCRQHLAKAAQQSRQQHDGPKTVADIDLSDDAWFVDNPLNDISEQYSSLRKSKPSTTRDDALGKERLTSKGRRARELEKHRSKKGKGTPNDFEDLKSSLAQSVDHGEGSKSQNETAFRRQAHVPVQKKQHASRAKTPEKRSHKPSAKASLPVDIMARLAKEEEDGGQKEGRATKTTNRPEADGSTTATASPAERQKFEDIVARLQSHMSGSVQRLEPSTFTPSAQGKAKAADDVAATEAAPSADFPQSDGGKLTSPDDTERITTPHFSFKPGTDEIAIPPGIVSSLVKPKSLQASSHVLGDDEAEDTMLGLERPLSFRRSNGPLSQWQKVQEAQHRPEWGGTTLGTTIASKASFDSLRAADKRSPEPVIKTAGETSAWGGEMNGANSSRAEQGLEKVDQAQEQGSVAERISRFVNTRFGELKKMLSDRVNDESQVQQNTPNSPKAVRPAGAASLETDKVEEKLRLRYLHSDSKTNRENARELAREKYKLSLSSAEVGNEAAEASSNDAFKRLAALSGELAPNKASDTQDGTFEHASGNESVESDTASGKNARMTAKQTMIHEKQEKRRRARLKEERREARKRAEAGERQVEPETQVQEAEGPVQSNLPPAPVPQVTNDDIQTFSASDLAITALNLEQPPVPPLQYGLDRALFNPGVYQLQDPHSRVYNFDPYLQKVMPVTEFDFNALKEYKTSSQDGALFAIARENEKKFIGSTSSMTGTLGHFHYLLSSWRPLNLNMFSRTFDQVATSFTNINRAPNAIFLRHRDGTYAIDADKEHDSPNVLMMLGKSMEKFLTMPKDQYERYRKGNPNPIQEDEKDEAESYEYTTMGNFLMRSQLDAYDSRLPGNGTFDLKTRAVVPIRMDSEDYKKMLGYEIHTLQGNFESYEREYYDMLRSTMLKYMLQARMGNMDGIFVAYHNVERIFGFQYLPIPEMDRAIHGQVDRCLGDQEFRASLKMMDEVMQKATAAFPGKSLRMYFETVETPMTIMWVFAEPMEENEIESIQNTSKERVAAFERNIMGIEEKPVEEVAKKAAPASDVTGSKPDESNASTQGDEDSYTTSASAADPAFYEKMNQLRQDETNLKPLFAATILCQNHLNGEPAQDNQVRNLHRKDSWEVQYILKEAQLTLPEKWARYEDCKTRRRRTHAKYPDGDEGEEASGERKENKYVTMLRAMSAKGREFRGKLDKLESGKEKIVVGVPPTPATMEPARMVDAAKDAESGSVSREVKDTNEYMDWLYTHQRLW